MHVKLAKDYSLLISSHKVGKIVHAFLAGRTMDAELWTELTLFVYRHYCVLDFIIIAVIKLRSDKRK